MVDGAHRGSCVLAHHKERKEQTLIHKNKKAFAEWYVKNFCEEKAATDTDNQGQIVIYTGWYEWEDGTIRSEQETYNSLFEDT